MRPQRSGVQNKNPSYFVVPAAFLLLGWLALEPSLASAQAPASQRYLDETDLSVQLRGVAGANDAGAYHIRVKGTLYGGIGTSDALRIDVRQGARTLASHRCEFGNSRADDGRYASLECDVDDTDLTAVGAVQVLLVYLDDQDGSAITIRSLNLRVVKYWSWAGGDSPPRHRAQFQVAGDDLLGVAYAFHISQTSQDLNARGRMHLYFWTSSGRSGRRNRPADLNNAALRCSVDGVRLHDLPTSGDRVGGGYEAENRVYVRAAPQDDDVERWQWNQVEMRVRGLMWGTHSVVVTVNFGNEPDPEQVLIMGDHPGSWTCDLRASGQVVRQFRFVVGADGRIAQHAEIAGGGGLRLPSTVVMLDTRFPNPNEFDFSFQPGAIRAAAPFGRPWAHPESVRDMLGALPPAVGSSEPSVVPAGARSRH